MAKNSAEEEQAKTTKNGRTGRKSSISISANKNVGEKRKMMNMVNNNINTLGKNLNRLQMN